MARRLLLSAFSALGVLSTLSSGRAADLTPVRIRFEPGAVCSTPEEFYAALSERSDRVRLAAAGEPAFEVRVNLLRREQGIVGELRVIHEQGETSERAVQSAECEDVVGALSLTAALALDAVVAEGAQAAPPLPEPSPDPVQAPVESAVAQEESSAIWAVEVGARAVVARVAAPYVNVGGGLAMRLLHEHGAWRASLGVALDITHSGIIGTAEAASIHWSGVVLSVCPARLALSDTFDFEPCLIGAGGLLGASGKDLSEPQSVTRSWWSAGGMWRLHLSLSAAAALELELGAHVPLVERRFVTLPEKRIVADTPLLSPFAQFGFVHRF